MQETIATKEVTVLKGQLSKLEKQATEIEITTPEEFASATNLKAKLKEIGKSITEKKEAITKPLNVALKNARALFAPLEEQFESAENIVGKKLIAWKQAEDARIKEEEAKIAARAEKGTIKMETAERKLEELGEKKTETTIHTDHGQVQFRKIKKVRVTDEAQIPDKYWVIDMVTLRKEALAGVVIPGAEVYEEETV